jgi:hypothetical protein
MSDATRYHTREEAKGMTLSALIERLARLEAAPQWQGVEFDDARVRHKRHTEILTLREIIASGQAALVEANR